MSKDNTPTPNERLHGVSWRELITEALASNGESWGDVIAADPGESWARNDTCQVCGASKRPSHRDTIWACVSPDEHAKVSVHWLDARFDNGFGSLEGHDFVLWTERHVYYVHEYDGSESVAWVPRNPTPDASSDFAEQMVFCR